MKIPRQKLFFAPIAALASLGGGSATAGALSLGSTGLMAGGLIQGARQGEEAEEQSRQQVKAMNRIAKAARENPQVAQQFLEQKQMSSSILQKQYAAIKPDFIKNATGFAKDIGKFAWGKKREIAGGLMTGAAISGVGYAVDKGIQHDMKKNNIPLDAFKPQTQEERQYSDPTTTTSPSTTPKPTSIMAKGGNLAKRTGNFLKSTAKEHLLNPVGGLMTVGFGAMPAIDYIADRQQYLDQVRATQQRNYAAVNAGMVGKVTNFFKNKGEWFKKGWEQFKEAPGQKTTDLITSVVGMGNGGKSGREKLVSELSAIGKDSGNQWTQNTAEFLKNHGKTASLAGGALGLGIMSAGWGQGEKLTKKGFKAIDKNAYAYQESKEYTPPLAANYK